MRTVRQIPPATPSGFDFLFRTRPRALWQQTPPEPVLILQAITQLPNKMSCCIYQCNNKYEYVQLRVFTKMFGSKLAKFTWMLCDTISTHETFLSVLSMGLLRNTKNCGCACARNAGNVFPAAAGKQSRHTSRHVRYARVPWSMPGSLTRGFMLNSAAGENFPGIPGASAIRNFTYLVRGPCHKQPLLILAI